MKEVEDKLVSELGDSLIIGEALKNHTSIKVGGNADYFYIAKEVNDLVKSVNLAYSLKIPYFILGGGYNIICSDKGFSGMVIKNECSNIAFSSDNSQVIVDSGVSLGKLINLAASRDLGGLEFLCGIPGTVGGSVYGNAGAFNYEIGDFVKSVTLLVPKEDKMVIIKKPKEWFDFSYRSSKMKKLFENEKFRPVILTVKLQLVRRRNDEILKMLRKNLSIKSQTQPLNEASSGCFFRNINKTKEGTAGYLLDISGAKKIRIGGAQFSKKHANFLINKKNATASDIRILSNKAKILVKEKCNSDLFEEVEYIGKW